MLDKQSTSTRFIGTFSLAMINAAAIINLNNIPSMAVLGLSIVTYILLAAFFFFLPTAFVSAELATGWPVGGGLYTWVKHAFGPRIGFLAIWLQWMTNVIWYPTVITPAVAGFIYTFAPQLVGNRWFLFFAMLSIFWGITFLNLRGMRQSTLISTVGVILGSLLPAGAIITFAVIWTSTGHPLGTNFHWSQLAPPFSGFHDLSILIALVVTLIGMEMSAVHASNVKEPRVVYPRAILLSTVIIMLIFILASLSMALILPPEEMDIITGLNITINKFCGVMHCGWLSPVLTILIAMGILTMASTWIVGPSKGLQVAALDGDIPAFFQKLNKKEMPSRIILLQAIIFTCLAVIFLLMPSIADSYWILIALAGQLYMLMYFIMFVAGIRLRYKYPQVCREYAIPGKHNIGMWIVAGMGLIGTGLTFVMTFFTPAQFDTVAPLGFVSILLTGSVAVCAFPFLLFAVFQHQRRRLLEKENRLLIHTSFELEEAMHMPIEVSKRSHKKKGKNTV